ncbi:sensor histidine kinase [Myxococcus sp. Y35]|uniref:sensor histidine kinase n=1 Tax=Pseudomyxococcus flavus TaxID=3115648 RepID=UPI003CEE4C64
MRKRAASVAGVLVLLLASGVLAQPVVEAPAEGDRVDLGQVIEVLEDPSGLLTVDEVASGSLPYRLALAGHELNVGFSRSTWWVHFTVVNPRPTAGEWRLELWRDVYVAELHTRKPGGGWELRRTGKLLALGDRDVASPRLQLRLAVEAGSSTECWLRLSSEDSLVLAPELWSQSALERREAETGLLWGTYYGVLVAMLAYNLFLFLSTRDGVYLSYFLFQLVMVLMQAAGDQLLFFYLWPEHPVLTPRSELLFIGLTYLFGLDFSRRFLDLSRVAPRLEHGMRALMALSGLYCVATLFPHAAFLPQAGVLLLALSATAILSAGVWAWRAGSPNALIFLLGWLALLLAAFASGLILLGWIPAMDLGINGPRLGSAVEAIVLSLALARRIKLLRDENERTRAELLESRLASARDLEDRVEARTRELSEALHALRATQARLLQQARLASLGQLVAGVAHEVGNPLNFVIGGADNLTQRLRGLREELDAAPPFPGTERVQRLLQGADRALGLVRDGNDRIRRIVTNLRDYVRSREATRELLDLNAELETTLTLLSPQLERSAVLVEKDLHPLPALSCRRGELGQVFMNLLLNSCQAMPSGGSIQVASREVEGGVELTFQDTGTGIPPEHREAIFDPFFTTRPPNEGTGLGLSISHEIVSRHGGELRLVDSPRGARFVVTLPLTPEP